jgi:hypothetical protein
LESGYFTNLMLVNSEGVARFVKKATRDKSLEPLSQKIWACFGWDIRISLEMSENVKIFTLEEFKKFLMKQTRHDREAGDYFPLMDQRIDARRAKSFMEIMDIFE